MRTYRCQDAYRAAAVSGGLILISRPSVWHAALRNSERVLSLSLGYWRGIRARAAGKRPSSTTTPYRRVMVVVTTYGSPWWFIKMYMRDPGKAVLMRGLGRLLSPEGKASVCCSVRNG